MNDERVPIREKLQTWNLNTVLQGVSLLAMLIGGVTLWNNQIRDVADMKEWRERFVQESRAADVRDSQRFDRIETNVNKLQSEADALQIRTNIVENNVNDMGQTNKEIQAAVAQLSGDMRVVREILQRQDAAHGRGGM